MGQRKKTVLRRNPRSHRPETRVNSCLRDRSKVEKHVNLQVSEASHDEEKVLSEAQPGRKQLSPTPVYSSLGIQLLLHEFFHCLHRCRSCLDYRTRPCSPLITSSCGCLSDHRTGLCNITSMKAESNLCERKGYFFSPGTDQLSYNLTEPFEFVGVSALTNTIKACFFPILSMVKQHAQRVLLSFAFSCGLQSFSHEVSDYASDMMCLSC